MAITALEFYSGIGIIIEISTVRCLLGSTGGLHYALKKSSVDARVLAAFDWDQLACRVYSHNFPETTVKQVHTLPLMFVNLPLRNA